MEAQALHPWGGGACLQPVWGVPWAGGVTGGGLQTLGRALGWVGGAHAWQVPPGSCPLRFPSLTPGCSPPPYAPPIPQPGGDEPCPTLAIGASPCTGDRGPSLSSTMM